MHRVKRKITQKLNFQARLEQIISGLLAIIMLLIVVHAPLSVFVGSKIAPLALGIKAWKEIAMAIVALLIVLRYGRRLVRDFRRDPLVILCGLYALLHVVLALPAANGAVAAIAGLMIDLRYIAYFVLVYVFTRYQSQFRSRLWRLAAIGAVIVLGFLLLQFVLPVDFLKHLGYSETTIAPYMLVDMNPAFVRYNSTLRGPNPLGAYAIIVVSIATAWRIVNLRKKRGKRQTVLAAFCLVAGLIAAWVSYSRSALAAAIGSAGLALAAGFGGKMPRRAWWILAGILAASAAGLYLVRDTEFFHTVVIHDNLTTGAATTSNDNHARSLADGAALMLQQPFGAGVGTTGSPAAYGSAPNIVENQYLMVAHEVGWLGLGLFMAICGLVLAALRRQRADWRALGLWASGIGLALVGVLLPVWADDTVSLVWWGLAATICSEIYNGGKNGKSNEKTA